MKKTRGGKKEGTSTKARTKTRLGPMLFGLLLIVFGSANLALNVLEFVRGVPNPQWTVGWLFVVLFAVIPIVGGIWMLSKAMKA